MYDKLVAKVNNIDTNDFVLKTKYDTDKPELEKKFPMWLILLKKQNSLNLKINKTDYNTKVSIKICFGY